MSCGITPDDSLAIDARGVSHAYGRHTVLRTVDVQVRRGELVTIIGPNGAGKSTLLRLLVGFMRLDAGSVALLGHPLGELDRRRIAQLAAFVPQGFALDFPFCVEEIVAMGREPHRGRFQPLGAGDRHAIAEALDATDAVAIARRSFAELSGGERQRVILARAFAQQSPLLVLDEPTASLDLLHAYRFMELVRERVRQGAATLAALHDLHLAARFSDRILVLHDGAIVADGTPADVLEPHLLERVFGVRTQILHESESSAPIVAVTSTMPKCDDT